MNCAGEDDDTESDGSKPSGPQSEAEKSDDVLEEREETEETESAVSVTSDYALKQRRAAERVAQIAETRRILEKQGASAPRRLGSGWLDVHTGQEAEVSLVRGSGKIKLKI